MDAFLQLLCAIGIVFFGALTMYELWRATVIGLKFVVHKDETVKKLTEYTLASLLMASLFGFILAVFIQTYVVHFG